MRKRIGPRTDPWGTPGLRTDPWGTPEVTGAGADDLSPKYYYLDNLESKIISSYTVFVYTIIL